MIRWDFHSVPPGTIQGAKLGPVENAITKQYVPNGDKQSSYRGKFGLLSQAQA